MKNILFSLMILGSFSLLADLEHTEGMEGKPTSERQTIARGCFKHLEDIGCGHPLRDEKVFKNCVQEHANQLSSNCKALMRRLYGKRE